MTAALRLVPISKEECRTRLEGKGKTALDDPDWLVSPPSSTAEEYQRHCNPITLKLCANTDDVIDVDEQASIEPEIVRYASRYGDGSNAAIVPLGRNYSTGIKWTAISRALCDVSLTTGKREVAMVDLASSPIGRTDSAAPSTSEEVTGEGAQSRNGYAQKRQPGSPTVGDNDNPATAVAFLSMRKPPGKHTVYLDGEVVDRPLGREVPIKDGSIISLYGATGFAYRVQLSQTIKNGESAAASAISESNSPKKRRANPPAEQKGKSPVKEKRPTARQQIRHRAHKLMVGEYTCAMCMDILVKSTFAIQCSHVFCNECSQQQNVTTCPTCRGNVTGWMPARSFDTIVWAAALQGCFERDDAEYYLERRETSGEPAPTEDEKMSVLNSEEEGHTTLKDRMLNGLISHNPELQPAAANVAIKTLPPVNPAASIVYANNNRINSGDLIASHQLPSQMLARSAEDNVICID